MQSCTVYIMPDKNGFVFNELNPIPPLDNATSGELTNMCHFNTAGMYIPHYSCAFI